MECPFCEHGMLRIAGVPGTSGMLQLSLCRGTTPIFSTSLSANFCLSSSACSSIICSTSNSRCGTLLCGLAISQPDMLFICLPEGNISVLHEGHAMLRATISPTQVIFTREWQPEGKPEHLRQNQTRLLDMYERISGGLKPLNLRSLKERIVCGHTGVIGLDTGRLYKFGYDHREEYTDKHPESRDIFRGFLQWFLAAYGLMKPETLQDKQVPTILIVERGEDEWRRIMGTEHFETYASSQGWHVERLNCRVASMEEQLMTLLRASLLVTVHGAAMAMAAFLPPRAVAVEMMPFGFTKEFYHGYANWLDMAIVSHVVWHEQEQMQHIGEVGVDVAGVSQPCGKNSDVFVTEASAADMLQTAHLIWMTPLGRREQTTYLNRPAVHQCNGK